MSSFINKFNCDHLLSTFKRNLPRVAFCVLHSSICSSPKSTTLALYIFRRNVNACIIPKCNHSLLPCPSSLHLLESHDRLQLMVFVNRFCFCFLLNSFSYNKLNYTSTWYIESIFVFSSFFLFLCLHLYTVIYVLISMYYIKLCIILFSVFIIFFCIHLCSLILIIS